MEILVCNYFLKRRKDSPPPKRNKQALVRSGLTILIALEMQKAVDRRGTIRGDGKIGLLKIHGNSVITLVPFTSYSEIFKGKGKEKLKKVQLIRCHKLPNIFNRL